MLVIVMLGLILVAAAAVVAWLWLQLQQEAQSVQEKSAEPVTDIKAMSADVFDEERDALQQQVAALTQELSAAKERAREQEKISGQAVTDLYAQCEEFRRRVAELEAGAAHAPAAAQDAATVDHWRAESAALKERLDESSAEIARLNQVIAGMQEQARSGKDQADAQAAAQQLVDAAKQEYQEQMTNFYAQIEQLRAENAQLQQQASDEAQASSLRRALDEFTARVRELEASGALIMEKNEYLQYELTKSRAEVAGLERLCENAAMLERDPQAEAGIAAR
jgi:chromosome segregation ATPase